MKANIIRIGNSRGIRLPKSLLQECGLDNTLMEVDIAVKNKSLVITRSESIRDGWENAFKKMAEAGDDELLDTEFLQNSWDESEWEWK